MGASSTHLTPRDASSFRLGCGHSFDTKRALVSCYMDRCLAVWTHEQFEQHLARAEAMEALGAPGRNLARLLGAMSAEVEIGRSDGA